MVDVLETARGHGELSRGVDVRLVADLLAGAPYSGSSPRPAEDG
jgi:hypothetical protein